MAEQESDGEWIAQLRARVERMAKRYTRGPAPKVQWHAGVPEDPGFFWLLWAPVGEDRPPFVQGHHIVERGTSGVSRLMILSDSGYGLWLDGYAPRILAHALVARPKPPGPRARLLSQGGRTDG